MAACVKGSTRRVVRVVVGERARDVRRRGSPNDWNRQVDKEEEEQLQAGRLLENLLVGNVPARRPLACCLGGLPLPRLPARVSIPLPRHVCKYWENACVFFCVLLCFLPPEIQVGFFFSFVLFRIRSCRDMAVLCRARTIMLPVVFVPAHVPENEKKPSPPHASCLARPENFAPCFVLWTTTALFRCLRAPAGPENPQWPANVPCTCCSPPLSRVRSSLFLCQSRRPSPFVICIFLSPLISRKNRIPCPSRRISCNIKKISREEAQSRDRRLWRAAATGSRSGPDRTGGGGLAPPRTSTS